MSRTQALLTWVLVGLRLRLRHLSSPDRPPTLADCDSETLEVLHDTARRLASNDQDTARRIDQRASITVPLSALLATYLYKEIATPASHGRPEDWSVLHGFTFGFSFLAVLAALSAVALAIWSIEIPHHENGVIRLQSIVKDHAAKTPKKARFDLMRAEIQTYANQRSSLRKRAKRSIHAQKALLAALACAAVAITFSVL